MAEHSDVYGLSSDAFIAERTKCLHAYADNSARLADDPHNPTLLHERSEILSRITAINRAQDETGPADNPLIMPVRSESTSHLSYKCEVTNVRRQDHMHRPSY
jgi:hypothetical protein